MMKKLLGIMVLGLLLGGNANAEKIILNCKGEFLGTKYDDYYIIDISKKTLKILGGENVNVEVTDADIKMIDINKNKSPKGYNIRFMRFDRYNGNFFSFNVYLNDKDFQTLQSKIESSPSIEIKSDLIELEATKAFANKTHKDNLLYGAKCKKSAKKF